METTRDIISKSPGDCDPSEIERFISLVREGGEVSAGGLESRIRAAAQLAFLRTNGVISGIAALKRPNPTYRSRVETGSGHKLPTDKFPFELGWVFIASEARGKGHALPLSSAALGPAAKEGVFATSRTDNVAMHQTLSRLSFVQCGTAYASQHGSHQLLLFVRVPSNFAFQRKTPAGAGVSAELGC